MSYKEVALAEEKVSVTCRLPKSIVARVDRYAEDRGVSRSAAVVSLLRVALGQVGETPASKADVQALRALLADGFERVSHAVETQPVQIAATLPEPEDAAREERERIRALGALDRLLGRF